MRLCCVVLRRNDASERSLRYAVPPQVIPCMHAHLCGRCARSPAASGGSPRSVCPTCKGTISALLEIRLDDGDDEHALP